MAFRPGRHSEEIAEINMIPLIDVMLVLLVIFMLAAPILTRKIPVDLPQAGAQSDTAKRSTVIEVTMTHRARCGSMVRPWRWRRLRASSRTAKQRGPHNCT